MSVNVSAPRLAKSPGQPAKRLSLADITKQGSGLPSRIVLHGAEGVGKSSLFAFSPNPIFITPRGETGLQTLIDSGRVPETPHFPEVQSWSELISAVEELTTQQHEYKTLVIDTINSAERLCHEHVCARDYNSDWGPRGFANYQQGYDVSLLDWRNLLIALDKLREVRRMMIVCTCHTKIKQFKNPEGPDYDRYTPDVHDKTWGITHKWADMVLFANFETFLKKEGNREKGKGGRTRAIYTVRDAAFDAKNRFGLPEEISMGNSGQEAWVNFSHAVKTAKSSSAFTAKGGE